MIVLLCCCVIVVVNCSIVNYSNTSHIVETDRLLCTPFFALLLVPGRYNDGVGKQTLSDCKECPQGTFSDVTVRVAVSDCKGCPNGKYGDKLGLVSGTGVSSLSCQACSNGR